MRIEYDPTDGTRAALIIEPLLDGGARQAFVYPSGNCLFIERERYPCPETHRLEWNNAAGGPVPPQYVRLLVAALLHDGASGGG